MANETFTVDGAQLVHDDLAALPAKRHDTRNGYFRPPVV